MVRRHFFKFMCFHDLSKVKYALGVVYKMK